MKLAILYTSHRQLRELDHAPAFYERSPLLKNQVDVLFHCNNAAIDESVLRDKLSKLPVGRMEVRIAPSQNVGGYVYGQYEALGDLWDHIDLSQWDWIVHLHPDLYLADPVKLLAAIEAADQANVPLLVSRVFGLGQPAYATDCFAFKPVPTMRTIFDGYKPLLATPIRVPTERVFFYEVIRSGLPHLVRDRFTHGHYYRDIDCWGVWHEHDLRRIEAYLRKPSSRWKYTALNCLGDLRETFTTLTVWAGRNVKHRPQDSLMAQWTRIEPKRRPA